MYKYVKVKIKVDKNIRYCGIGCHGNWSDACVLFKPIPILKRTRDRENTFRCKKCIQGEVK